MLSVISKTGMILYYERWYPDANVGGIEARCAQLCKVDGYFCQDYWYPAHHIDFVSTRRAVE